MMGIGGNTTGIIQRMLTSKNAIGEDVKLWEDCVELVGWLDLAGGDANYQHYSTKVQESTHLFICDYVPLPPEVRADSCRMIVEGDTYDITLIDNPMGMKEGSQLEIFLKYTGGRP